MNKQKVEKLENIVASKHKNITGIIVREKGNVSYENYFSDCNKESKIHIYSVTKSIMSLLIGIAIEKGLIKSLDQKVLDYFPEYSIKKRENTIQNITLRDLMTMTAPYKYGVRVPYIKYFSNADWVQFSLDLLGGKGNIGDFNYTPLIGPDILSGILVKATGQSVLEFARENLFGPLDIHVEKSLTFNSQKEQMAFNKATNISGWVQDKVGINSAGWGLTLTTEDMSKIGQCCLDKGVYEDNQVIPSHWIENLSVERSIWKKMNLSYSYLWWVIDEDKSIYAAIGDGGNVIYVNESKELVVAITAKFKRNVTDRIEFIRKYIDI